MKKILIILSLAIVIISIVWLNYNGTKEKNNDTKKINQEFSNYYNRTVYGTEVATAINKAIDENTRNNVEKDEKNYFLTNNENSIKIEIEMVDNNKKYRMENFYNNGIEKFVQYYGNVKFECTQIEYHESTNRVKYLYFKQIS